MDYNPEIHKRLNFSCVRGKTQNILNLLLIIPNNRKKITYASCSRQPWQKRLSNMLGHTHKHLQMQAAHGQDRGIMHLHVLANIGKTKFTCIWVFDKLFLGSTETILLCMMLGHIFMTSDGFKWKALSLTN